MKPAEQFFLRTLPRLIANDVARWSVLRGTLAFSCAGEKFTVQLGDLDTPVRPGFARDAHLRLFFFGDAFERFLDAEPPSQARDVRLQGNTQMFATLGAFLQPPKSALSIQL